MITHSIYRILTVRLTAIILVITGTLFTPGLQAAHTIGLYANISPLGASSDLSDVESLPARKLFASDYSVDYDQIAQEIKNGKLKQELDKIQKSSTMSCPGLCKEVRWSITPTSNVTFVEKPLPQAILLSNAEHAVHMSLDTTVKATVHLVFNAEVDAVVPLPIPFEHTVSKSITVDISVESPTTARADIYLYPVVKLENLQVHIDPNKQPVVYINGLKETLGLAGAGAGSVMGFTPLGIATGGPLAWGITGAIFGSTEGAQLLQQELQKLVEQHVHAMLVGAQAEAMRILDDKMTKLVPPNPNIKDQIMNTPIAGWNRTLNELKYALGLSMDARTIKSGTDVKTTITARYSGLPGGGNVNVNLILPEKRCVPLPGNKHMFEPHNEDITIGQSCQALFGGGLASRPFLGQTPPGTSMPNWKTGGMVFFKGTVKRNRIASGISLKSGQPNGNFKTEGWLVCEAEINGLPQAGVIELVPGGKLAVALTDAYNKDQRVLYTSGRQLNIGGWGTCDGVGGKGVPEAGKPRIISDKLDCPQCLGRLRKPAEEQVQTATGQGIVQSVIPQGMRNTQILTQGRTEHSGRTAQIQSILQRNRLSVGMHTRQGRLSGNHAGNLPAAQAASLLPGTDQGLGATPRASNQLRGITPRAAQSRQPLRISVTGRLVKGGKLSLDIELPSVVGKRMSVRCLQGACTGQKWIGTASSQWEIPNHWIGQAGHYRLEVSVGDEDHEVAFNVAK